ncbi:FAA hydrolase family protein [Pseudoalteromonas sp. MEBiC 03607]|jgi:2-keto-4-pentenoate hydratase/2-oxohepta-3-ene-1,7-dioic acid hydratase in catechol pathway|uniref:fumarylacetoacetate hydrolase family protein n=1 Tax=Pseudoalteromonas TaxID=53246 RepID=UPI000C5FD5A3|nr:MULTISPECIES: fumarylacetoacetate hydrolase family protein [unclassified Pseudoalteromonas]MBU75887.1 fumarylacetoacetate hydrolase [Pseudoalteromonadaceae bacterium]HCV02553.1 FAA hydrolase family protein [Pseudoalteromonas sp.]MCF2898968.1 fumarylacetoacetate hydrolase family protein [Pseudoalteromonas sp. OFAV1]MCF2921902.1 fumarylacetoacetate hydrolase family protein [Pseudoalteromonas sp. APAL1]MCO7249642.1 fumarylacetoacetate hydrolase family protein [Pseudoalteromonas sp. Ps84H-4]|tara:strand:- start:601 stop:1212 length:612 start_codon:yes stop_codon:yes gene_type:complete
MHSVKLASEEFTPSKIVCVGRNYAEHIAELNNETPTSMVLFVKPNSAISQQLHAEHNGEALHYETELCFLIKNKQLAGVGLGLDLTKRSLQSALKEKGLPWERAKAFNGAALFTEFVSCDEALAYQFNLQIDGKEVQFGDTQLMLHDAQQILSEISEFMDLEDGDIIMTGTPKGVGKVTSGAIFKVTLQAAEQTLLSHQWQSR